MVSFASSSERHPLLQGGAWSRPRSHRADRSKLLNLLTAQPSAQQHLVCVLANIRLRSTRDRVSTRTSKNVQPKKEAHESLALTAGWRTRTSAFSISKGRFTSLRSAPPRGPGESVVNAPLASTWKTYLSFWSFPYVCPEPVLVK